MIEEFLKKYQDTLIQKEKKLKKALGKIEIDIRRQQKYIDMISAEHEEPFSAFTPHVTDRKKNIEIENQLKKMDELQQQRDVIHKEYNIISEDIKSVERSLIELNEKEETIKILSEKNSNISNEEVHEVKPEKNKEDVPHENIDINKLKTAYDFLPVDPNRAKQIIKTIIDNHEK